MNNIFHNVSCVVLQEQIEHRRTQLDEFNAWRAALSERYNDEKEARLELHGGEFVVNYASPVSVENLSLYTLLLCFQTSCLLLFNFSVLFVKICRSDCHQPKCIELFKNGNFRLLTVYQTRNRIGDA